MIPYYRPYYNWLELRAALRPGAERGEFESALAARVGARYGIAFAYGRAGVVAALKALGLARAEVILPAYTCLVMARAVMASGNFPAFVDIKLDDYNMDVSALKRALTPQTRVVVATHLYGYPTDVAAIRTTIGDERIIILEDCAQGLLTFSPRAHKLCGDLGLFSFGPGKPLCTVQGGIIVTNSPDLYEKIKVYRDKEMEQFSAKVFVNRWAWLLSSYLVFQKWFYGPLYWCRYRAKPIGNARPEFDPSPMALPSDVAVAYADFQARIGLAQLCKLDAMVTKRRALARLYDQELRAVPAIYPAPLIDGATYSFYTLRVPRRDEVGFGRRMASRGVSVDQSYDYALPYLKPYSAFAREAYPCAAQAASQVINLPCYPGLQEAQVRYIAACVRDCVYEIDRG
jgi:perosamine synthetase